MHVPDLAETGVNLARSVDHCRSRCVAAAETSTPRVGVIACHIRIDRPARNGLFRTQANDLSKLDICGGYTLLPGVMQGALNHPDPLQLHIYVYQVLQVRSLTASGVVVSSHRPTNFSHGFQSWCN